MEGTVKWYNRIKAYGFIEVEGREDLFVHKNEISEGVTLNEGDSVSFEIGENEKGQHATNVQKI
jgi:CspA family cold shock protein